MPSLSKFLADNRALSEKEADWLQHLIGDWNLLSDLLRADLVLWIQEEQGPLAVAHCRPATGSTVYYEDPVGSPSDDGEESAEITRLLAGGEPHHRPTAIEREGRTATGLLVPVRKEGRTLAVLAAESPVDDARTSHNETQKRRLGERLLRMLETGAFPSPEHRSRPAAARRGWGTAWSSSTRQAWCSGSRRMPSRPSTASASRGTWWASRSPSCPPRCCSPAARSTSRCPWC